MRKKILNEDRGGKDRYRGTKIIITAHYLVRNCASQRTRE